MASKGIDHIKMVLPPNKTEVQMQNHQLFQIMNIIMDRSRQPVLIHCNRGKHRTGCSVGFYRLLTGSRYIDVLLEYRTFAHGKAREKDEEFLLGCGIPVRADGPTLTGPAA